MLNCPTRSDRKNYKYLPVSTSYEQELAKTAEDILTRERPALDALDHIRGNR